MKYRKKPVVVEAVQYTGSNFSTIKEFADGCDRRVAMAFDDEVMIRTLEGDMIARPGDWIIKGVHGELYPCKPDIFAETYEEASNHFVDAGKRSGKWIRVDNTKCRCSECDVIHLIAQYPHGEANYCPNCGAIMSDIPPEVQS